MPPVLNTLLNWLSAAVLHKVIAAAFFACVAFAVGYFYRWIEHPDRFYAVSRFVPALQHLSASEQRERIGLLRAASVKGVRRSRFAIMICSIVVGFVMAAVITFMCSRGFDAIARTWGSQYRMPDAFDYVVVPLWILLTFVCGQAFSYVRLRFLVASVDGHSLGLPMTFDCQQCKLDLSALPDEFPAAIAAERFDPAAAPPVVKLCKCPRCGKQNLWCKRRSDELDFEGSH